MDKYAVWVKASERINVNISENVYLKGCRIDKGILRKEKHPDQPKPHMKDIEKFVISSKLVGDSHRYKSDKGEISLLYPCYATMSLYEIYCIEGNLFEDTERFDSLEETEERINALLTNEPEDQRSVARNDATLTDDGKQNV